MIGKPILFNPNCFLNIDKILSELKANLKIGDECEWIILGQGTMGHHFLLQAV